VQLEEIQLAIRPRTILECLDVSFLFCGRHWLGLLLTAALGIVPIFCFNEWVVDIRNRPEYGSWLLLVMEVPWATLFITLYLGQTTFSPRLSIRRMFEDGLNAIPSFLLFQVIIRGLCVAVCILTPVVFLGMYYLNEILLLEKPPIARAWNRRTAMNAQIMGRILSIRILDLLILCGGTIAVTQLFQAITSLWEDRFDPFYWMQEDLDPMQESVVHFPWQTHLAFWVVIVFLTVFRFVSYLDCRIRREGWDVDLKLRAQTALLRQREGGT
jgi:hypothetical protein